MGRTEGENIDSTKSAHCALNLRGVCESMPPDPRIQRIPAPTGTVMVEMAV